MTAEKINLEMHMNISFTSCFEVVKPETLGEADKMVNGLADLHAAIDYEIKEAVSRYLRSHTLPAGVKFESIEEVRPSLDSYAVTDSRNEVYLDVNELYDEDGLEDDGEDEDSDEDEEDLIYSCMDGDLCSDCEDEFCSCACHDDDYQEDEEDEDEDEDIEQAQDEDEDEDEYEPDPEDVKRHEAFRRATLTGEMFPQD